MTPTLLLALLLAAAPVGAAEKKKADAAEKKDVFSADTFSGLAFRGLGPAVASGRVSDIAVSPRPGVYFVAVASGGVWRTTNWGTTFTPVFDKEGSYSIGCLAIDPNDPLTIWVGTGENNAQRSVGFGDGVYRSTDEGKTWENVGLRESEHIGRIVVDPRDSKVVYVAAQGPLWSDGGDRGLYKTTDGGKAWTPVLKPSDKTGVNEVWLDPRNPDVLYATTWQRRRHVWTFISGGPESALYKSTDAGATWKKLAGDFPKAELGRIGLAVAPSRPDTVYAIVESSDKKAAGFWRSTDAGGSWERRGDLATSGNYYQELVPDPVNPDRVYAMDVFLKVTDDGGKTWRNAGETEKHVDNHALWIDPANTDHLLNGNDGGVYESWDRARTWQFKPNLPVTQFYRISVDDAEPFYSVYGGTQDNCTLGGPSRTRIAHGIRSSDWFMTLFGDGFHIQVDPGDPNLVYTETQYGGLGRFDRRTGEKIDIQPQPGPGEEPLRFNWDSPLLLSPHSRTRLYFAAQKLFRSDDRGDSWRAVSPDLTARIDRNALKVMGRVWGVDAVAKSQSTSFYGNIVALDESPRTEGLLYVGTDDGLVQVSEDGGGTWRRQDRFPGVPERTYVADLHASPHDGSVVYAAFNNHKMGDFKPYLLKSGDRGRTWTQVAAGLPERGPVWTVREDARQPGLLFAGTEFGVFFSPDGGTRWVQLKGGLPTIAVRDLAIHEREDDLVLATFGRGFYVLDDLAPLRLATAALLEKEAALFPVRRAWMYVPEEPLGIGGRAFQGASFYTADNPPFGAVFTYYLKEEIRTLKKRRQEEEKKIAEKGGDVAYPAWEALEQEAREEDPAVVLTVTDADGQVVRRLIGPVGAGFHRVAWDLRLPAPNPTSLEPFKSDAPWRQPPEGPLALPGGYRVSLAKRQGGILTPLGEPQSFRAEALGAASLPAPDREAVLAFAGKTARLQRAVLGADKALSEATARVDHLKKALEDALGADPRLMDEVREIGGRLRDLKLKLAGGTVREERQEPETPSIKARVASIVDGHWRTTQAPTETHRRAYEAAAAEFEPVLAALTRLIDADLPAVEAKAEAGSAPWTPGRVPRWTKE
jgi:photosystem II stability/assembly factor-like uncharacterized protein